MCSYKLVAAAAVGMLAFSGCSSLASSEPSVPEGTVVNGCRIAPNADCKGINLAGTDLHNANLSGANLEGADLSNANLMSANLTNANLAGAKMWFTNLESADLSGAKVVGNVIVNANLIHAVCPDGVMARNSICPNT